ncbi:MAG: hypothetical protein D8M59_17030, partial [Planctomycetes bacterium]|nr:hypothetical protein [Planctomycetota bacterium]
NPLQTENASPNGTAIVGWARSSGSNLGVYGLANGATGTGVFGLAKSASDSASFGGRFESRSSIGRGVYAIASSNGSGQSFGGWFQSNSSKGRGIQGYVSSATGKTYGGIFQSNSNQGYGVYGLAANAGDSVTFGGNFRSKSTKGYGVFGIADATSGTTYGVFGRSNSPTGHGVYGYGGAATGNAYGVVGETRSVAGTGVYGLAYSDTGDTYGGYFVSHSTGGVGVYGYTDSSTGGTNGVMGVADSEYGTGVYGLASNVNGSQYGGFFQTNGSSGAALVGYASSTTGGAQAVRAECFSPSSTTLYTAANSDTGTPKAIYAWCAADYGYAGYFAGGRNYFGGNTGFGTNQAPLYSVDVGGLMRVSAPNSSPEGQVAIRGVTQIDGALCIYGLAAGESGTRTGIYGVTDATSGNYGVLSNGNSGATGVKSFHIDHPLDPENQFLDHFSAEGPEPYLMYRGNAMLDENGETWVQLPDYFEAINRDYHYQLTSIGAPGPNLYIADKIRNNRFRIAGGTPGAEVSWTVTGVRDDPWVQTHPTSDEYSKPQNQRGKYLRPDLYGRPQSDEIYHVPR